MRIKIEMNIRTKELREKVRDDRALWTFMAAEWFRLYTPYVPFRTGVLNNTVDIRPGMIEHLVPYARYQYYGTHLNHMFGSMQHPLASAKWDKRAEPLQKPKLILTMQNYIDSGRLKL